MGTIETFSAQRWLRSAPTTSWDALIANRRATVGLFIAALVVYGVVIPAEFLWKMT